MVLGVSFDTVDENKAFAEKFDFGYPLLCDTDRKMGIAYRACKDASAKYPDRITYIIDADGRIDYAEKVGDIEAHIHAAIAHLNDA